MVQLNDISLRCSLALLGRGSGVVMLGIFGRDEALALGTETADDSTCLPQLADD
ncbi:MAG: hypothetical protein M3Q71_15720 [Chloroflexota bacterium]|nr:hypothetical protein [Chloroflexota bacterium]